MILKCFARLLASVRHFGASVPHLIKWQELVAIVLFSFAVFLTIFAFLYSKLSPSDPAHFNFDYLTLQCSLLTRHVTDEISDLERMKNVLLGDLAMLERKRNSEVLSIRELQSNLSALSKQQWELQESVGQLTVFYRRLENEMKFVKSDVTPHRLQTIMPANSVPCYNTLKAENTNTSPTLPSRPCLVETCFNTTKCSLSGNFTFYLFIANEISTNLFIDSFRSSIYRVNDYKNACLVFAFVGEALDKLPIWSSYTNMVLFPTSNISHKSLPHAAIVNSHVDDQRRKFDMTIPELSFHFNTSLAEDFNKIGKIIPVERGVMLSYLTNSLKKSDLVHVFLSEFSKVTRSVAVDFNCAHKDALYSCAKLQERLNVLANSTFAIIYGPTKVVQSSLVEAMSQSCVPVLIGDIESLPFWEVIDWHLSVVVVPPSRIYELGLILDSFTHTDIANMRIRGRDMFMQYFSNSHQLADTIVALWRHRLRLPAASIATFNTEMKQTISPPITKKPSHEILDHRDSPEFQSRFSHWTSSGYIWNSFPGPFWTYPSHPFIDPLPSEAKFNGSEAGFRPINFGRGGDGRYFGQSLGGNSPAESFTIVVLAYKREQILMQLLAGLDKLPFLHSVVVVWNAPSAPEQSLVWPEIHVPIRVVKGAGNSNSLNNRFLPFSEIKTDAVLSLDDDVFLTHEEILLTFRIWRENRDRLVGLPGRQHSWDPEKRQWVYNREIACEFSLVLTGAAFFHKYYLFVYTNSMPAVIRAMVDEYMNCEDIAFNFLISHITRKPPIKTTSKRTFLCKECGEDSLWFSSNHVEERDRCVNYFAHVYGYTPLLYTQHRSDSALYHNAISQEEVKCFVRV